MNPSTSYQPLRGFLQTVVVPLVALCAALPA